MMTPEFDWTFCNAAATFVTTLQQGTFFALRHESTKLLKIVKNIGKIFSKFPASQSQNILLPFGSHSQISVLNDVYRRLRGRFRTTRQ
jgi:hypothetical protein